VVFFIFHSIFISFKDNKQIFQQISTTFIETVDHKKMQNSNIQNFSPSNDFLLHKMCPCHDIAEILLELALNINQSIIQSSNT
jgi:hypothetical protein